jgi:anti-sigma B factor antagonist
VTDPNTRPFCVAEEISGEGTRLACSGELDLASTPLLMSATASLLLRKPRAIIIDFEAVSFVDSSGLHAVLEAVQNCRDQSVHVHVRPGRALSKLLELTQTDVPTQGQAGTGTDRA